METNINNTQSYSIVTNENINLSVDTIKENESPEKSISPQTQDLIEKKDEIEESNKVQIRKGKPVRYQRKARYIVFTLFMIINLVMNMDHGVMPAVTKEMKEDLDIDPYMLGIFGSMVYFGNLLGNF